MKSNQDGFSYIDVMIAVTLLLFGVMALAAAVTTAVVRSRETEQQMIARQLVSSSMESIFSARDIPDRLGWDSIGNVGSNVVNGVAMGVFLTGQQQILADTGPDNVVGTADDTGAVMFNYKRQITITDICDPTRPSPNCPTPGTYPVRVRQVDVVIYYNVGTLQRLEKATSVITTF